MKKIFFISVLLLALVLIFWGLYVFVYKNSIYAPSVDSSKTTFTNKKTPVLSEKKEPVGILSGTVLQKAVAESVVGATLDKEDQYLWYATDTNPALIRKQDSVSGGVETVMTLTYSLDQIRWSPDTTQALAQETSASGEHWHLLDVSTGTDTPLKEGLRSPVWTNAGDRIVYVYTLPNKSQSVTLSRPDGSEWKQLAVLDIRTNIALAVVPQSALVAAWNIPSAFDETHFETISLGGGDPQPLIGSRFGSDYAISPNGTKIFQIGSDRKGGNRMMAGVSNALGGEYRALDVATFGTKIAWGKDNATIYYALPSAPPQEAVVPDDYRKRAFETQDTFWKIDTNTGKKSRLIELADMPEAYDATKLFLDGQEQLLFFIDRKSHFLYRVKL
jgi:hypothetical protein